ncbi:MAG: hypothetical protein QN131_06565 [Armatimonadota bacterium]|nr:hypothetical protein [Armatimonadota bacterium]MDR7549587.1 hypothetical protein [Armatimonadota bacterium]
MSRRTAAAVAVLILPALLWVLLLLVIPQLKMLDLSLRFKLPIDQVGTEVDVHTLANYREFASSALYWNRGCRQASRRRREIAGRRFGPDGSGTGRALRPRAGHPPEKHLACDGKHAPGDEWYRWIYAVEGSPGSEASTPSLDFSAYSP